MTKHKDLFSKHAPAYAKYRPHYPEELIRYLLSLCRERRCAWDCATGNGQVAYMLAAHFDRVIATDLSAQQIALARAHANINYYVATAEESGITDSSVDLITVAQALHWFDLNAFAREVRRVAKHDAILAVWCYDLAHISDAVDAIIRHLYDDILGDYWDSARKLVETNYESIVLPFSRIPSTSFAMSCEWQLSHLLGYVRTWSALQKFVAEENYDPLIDLEKPLSEAFGAHVTRRATWTLKPKVWRV